MTDLILIARYGKEHGLSYGQVSVMLAQGQLTYDEVGIVRKEKPKKKAEAKKYVRP